MIAVAYEPREEFAYGAPSLPPLRLVPAAEQPRASRRIARALLVLVGVVAIAVLAAPAISYGFGYRTLLVTSGSMEPFASAGDAVLLERVDATDVEPGDVITFRPLRSTSLMTHRVASLHHVEGEGLHFRTRGDANGRFDPNLVPAPHVFGRVVWTVPALGRLYAIATSTTGRIVLVVVPALVIACGEVLRLARRRPRGARLAAVSGVTGLVLMLALPALSIFTEAVAVGSNDLSSGQVDPPTLDSATPDVLPCRVTLAWTAPATGLAPDGYDVLRSTTSGGPYGFVKHVGVVTTTTDTTVAANTTYYYVLESTLEQWKSTNSNERSATTPVVCV